MDKNTYMKLSIIVPVYNVKQYIDKCITSILDQSFKDFELILVDDGSTDGSGDVCEAYAKLDHRIRVYHQLNQGQAVARNFAIRKANGDYIGFVDSDDWIQPEMYEHLINAAQNKNADIVVCRLQTVSEEENVMDILGYEDSFVMDKIKATTEILLDHKMKSFPVNKIYKKNLFNGLEFPANRYFEDTAIIYKVIYNANLIVTIPYIGYNYRFNPNSTCNNKSLDYSKLVKREFDNALAFGERYIFCKKDARLKKVLKDCANKAYMRIRGFIHLQAHKGLKLTPGQKEEIDAIMKSFSWGDLQDFSIWQKMDLIAYRYSKPLLSVYLRILTIIHPMSRNL